MTLEGCRREVELIMEDPSRLMVPPEDPEDMYNAGLWYQPGNNSWARLFLIYRGQWSIMSPSEKLSAFINVFFYCRDELKDVDLDAVRKKLCDLITPEEFGDDWENLLSVMKQF